MSTAITIAIDGPSGSGKSSVSRAVARALRIGYLDTGAMYRALTWWCLATGSKIDLADQAMVAQAARDMPLAISSDPDRPAISVAGQDVTAQIRESRISERVSAVATNMDVRDELRWRQRELIVQIRDQHGGVVTEGRDITTVVAPDADYRILLTADEQTRLSRRAAELHGRAEAAQLDATRDQVLRRDRDDSTVSEFLEPASGVHHLDTSALTLDEAINAVLALVQTGASTPHTDEEMP